MRGIPIFTPDSLSVAEKAQAIILLAIHNREVDMPTLISRLAAKGYRFFVTLIELYDHFASELGERYWLARRDFYSGNENEIRAVLNLFTDEASRSLFDSLLDFRKSGDYSLLPAPDLAHQYFSPDVPPWKYPLRFVDCGAFDGDTLRDLAQFDIPIEALAAFEPDQDNFQKLAKYVREKEIPNSYLWPCGVYSSSTQMKFLSEQGEASVIAPQGAFTIQCVSLDEAIPNFTPTLIKMDIEGAEVEALRGAQHIIQEYKPGLAICVYHRPSHIWEVPLLIEQMLPGTYRCYLRAHAFNDFEVVLYAVPI